jgi:hypothetical protein
VHATFRTTVNTAFRTTVHAASHATFHVTFLVTLPASVPAIGPVAFGRLGKKRAAPVHMTGRYNQQLSGVQPEHFIAKEKIPAPGMQPDNTYGAMRMAHDPACGGTAMQEQTARCQPDEIYNS